MQTDGANDLDQTLRKAKSKRTDAVFVLQSPYFYINRQRLADAAVKQHLPTVFQDSSAVSAGGLVSYGPTASDSWMRVGYFVDRIMKGAKPGEIPIEQPTKFELVVNLKTAKALGITIPESILLRADEVIR
jgi:putative ABC transport system substrate-binding protein